MVGDDDAIDAALARDACIGRCDQALDHQLAVPAAADQFDMFPGELVAIADVAHQVFGKHRRPAHRVHILEMRHAVIHQRARPGAEQPMRMRDGIPGDARRDGERDLKTVADIVFAVRWNRHVGRHDEGVIAGRGHPIDQRLDARGIARQIGLIPGRRIFAPHVFQRDQGGRAENHRHILRGSRARQHNVPAIGGKRRGAHRRNAERCVIRLAEQLRGLHAVRDVL